MQKLSKDKLSIQLIGRQRFWVGLIGGTIAAILLSLFFNYSRESLRFVTFSSGDLLIPSKEEFQFFNLFFAALSSVFGLSLSIWIWLQIPILKNRRRRRQIRLSALNAVLMFWIILMVIARFGTIFPFILFASPGYDNHFNFYEEFWYLFVLLLLVLFLHNWMTLNIVFKTGYWMLYSFLFCVLFTIVLSLTTSVNQENLNQAYYRHYESEYLYLEEELTKAENKYGLEFSPFCIETLKKWKTDSSIEQVHSLKMAFARNSPVSLDSIILEKIVFHNLKEGIRPSFNRYSLYAWYYTLPSDILKQINLNKSDTVKTYELFELLKLQFELANTEKLDLDKPSSYSSYELRRNRALSYSIPVPALRLALKEVRDSLEKQEVYQNLVNELPKIEDPIKFNDSLN